MSEATWRDTSHWSGWQYEHDGNGNITGYWRPVALDDARGGRQQEVQAGSDYAFEYVPADAFDATNGVVTDPQAVEYRTGGTSIHQSDNVPLWAKIGAMAPLALGGAYFASPGFAGFVDALNAGTAAGLGGLGGTPEITAEMLAGANATSDPIAYLNAQAGWTAADPAYMASLTTVPPGTMTPGYSAPPEWPASPSAGPAAPSGGPAAPPAGPAAPPAGPPAPASPGGLVKTLTDAGLPAWLANAIVGLGPAGAALLSDHDPQSTTSQTNVSPQQQGARDAIATAVTNRLPEGMARDRQRADQQMAWANLAAAVPSQYTMPAPVVGQGMTAPQPVFGRQGMMGGFVPPNSMIRRV